MKFPHDRRKDDRAHLKSFLPSTFEYKGKRYNGLLVDLSEEGAQFRHDEYCDDLHIGIGEEIQFSVSTPYGDSSCTGKVEWEEEREEYYWWGIRFTKLPRDSSDPLRTYMESSF